MTFKFSGINICSKKPEIVFEFYKKLGFIEEGRLKDHFHKGLDEIQLGKFYD